MDERRKKRREAKEREDILKYRAFKPKIQQQFADLKRQLVQVSEDEWANLPDVGDHRAKRMKKQKEKEIFLPVPDSVIVGSNVEMASADQSQPGSETPLADFTQLGNAREKVLSFKLDQVSDAVKGNQSVDPIGYLTDLKSVSVKSDAEIGDINKARLLYKNLLSTNPKHAPGWISAARLEEVSGKLSVASKILICA
jgi:pre-mRNA-processing factor 6